MIRIIIVFLLFFSGALTSFSQDSKLMRLADKMFFNIFEHKPDSSVLEFIKRYFTGFVSERTDSGWTMYLSDSTPVTQSIVHTLVFNKHPFFNADFHEGRLDMMTQEEPGNEPKRGLTGFQLWFLFNSKKDAKEGFKKLSMMFDSVSTAKKVVKKNGRTIADYTDKPGFDWEHTVEFILTGDELDDNKYKILFRWGCYSCQE